MIAIIDYGAGNIHSVKNALSFIGTESVCTSDSDILKSSDGVILPGVGSFEFAMDCMKSRGLIDTVKKLATNGKPFLGICLGMQMLFEYSEESPGVKGLGILEGCIKRIPDSKAFKVPHIGWNSISIYNSDGIFKNIHNNSFVYFVHSYFLSAKNKNDVSSSAFYSVNIDASISVDNLFGVQFHPEKSGDIGIKMLKNFSDLCSGGKN